MSKNVKKIVYCFLIITVLSFILGIYKERNFAIPNNIENTNVVIIDTNNFSFDYKNNENKEKTKNATKSIPNKTNILNDEEKENENNNSFFEIIFIDVGQGDSILVSCDNHYMLIDGGPSNASSIVYTILKNKQIDYLDYVVNTHPDEDHIGGLSGALNYARVGKVYSPYVKESAEYENFQKYVELAGSKIEKPAISDSFYLGSSNVDILATNVGSFNEASIVLKITYGSTSFLLMGDAGTDVEDYLLTNNINVSCDVLKIGHHGSEYGTGYYFLRTTDPKFAVISVGRNDYGHPSEKVIGKLKDLGVTTYRTDLQGDIVFRSDGTNLSIEVENEYTN